MGAGLVTMTPNTFCRDAADAVIRILRDRNPIMRATIDEMHPADLRDLEERIGEAVWKCVPERVKDDL